MQELHTLSALSPGVAQGISWVILQCLVCFWLLSILVAISYLPVRIAVPVITLKFLLVGTYFVTWGDGSWYLGGDDWTYAAQGYKLLEGGENPISVWWSSVGNYLLVQRPSTALYIWWNMLWMYLFESAYYVPVVANVFVTVLSGFLFDKILKGFGFGGVYRIGFGIFFLLHWYTLAWSSFLNIKEPLITSLILLTIYSILQLEQKRWQFIVALLTAVFLLFGIRFYMPALIGGAAVLYLILESKKKIVTLLIVLPILGLILWKYWFTIGLVFRLIDTTPKSVAVHLVKNILSPIPWKITEPATYLYLPSILHWIFLPASIVGAISLMFNRQTTGARLILWVIAAGYGFYALIPGLASVRHGSPFAALWTLFEYNFIYYGLKYALGHSTHKNNIVQGS